MKKFSIGILALLIVLSLVGCGVKAKLEQKAGEALAEKFLGDAGVDADIDGDKIIFKGEDGEEVTVGSGEWPSSDLAKTIPEFKKGKISSVMEFNDSLVIIVDEVSEDDFTPYLEEIKEKFAEEAYNMETDTGIMYMAENGEGISIVLTYEKDLGLGITINKAASKGED